MRFIECENEADLGAQAAAIMLAEFAAKPDLLLCAATGRSPGGAYQTFVEANRADPASCARLRIVTLDEWGGMSGAAPGSSAHYLRARLVDPLGISPDRFLTLDGAAADPAAECARMRRALDREGPVDLCILGLGINGHVGFNEPGPFLVPHCHVAELSPASRGHTMVRSMDRVPTVGLTLGMRDILAARRIVLLVTGDGKRDVTVKLRTAVVTPALPASFLWLHGNADCLIDRAVLGAGGGPPAL